MTNKNKVKICILLLIHRDVEAVNRLIAKLKNDNIDIYIHVDKKSNIDISKLDASAKIIQNTRKVYFADYTQTYAIISSLKEIIANKKYDYYLFLSGQDYPIISSDKIVDFFTENNGKIFIDYKRLGKDHWNVAYRYEKPFFRNRYIRFIIRRLPIKLKFIDNYVPYGGDSWFNITNEALELLLEEYENKKIYKRVKSLEMPEEIIFQSILVNSKLKNKIINDSLRYIDWSEHNEGLNPGHPNILTEKDYNKIINSKKIFCRKTEPNKSEKLMELLDQYIEKNN